MRRIGTIFTALLMAQIHLNTSNGDQSMHEIAMALRSDARLISIGDSLSTAFWSRPTIAGLRVWPIQEITAIGGGAGLGPAILRCNVHCNQYNNVLSADDLGYTVERANKKPQFYTLPIRGLKEIFTNNFFSPNDSTGNLFELNLNVDELDTSVHGPMLNADDNLRFRLLYRASSQNEMNVDTLSLKDYSETVLTFQPANHARKLWHDGETPDGIGRDAIATQINAVATDVSAVNQLGSIARMYVAEDTILQGTDKYFQLAGGVYYKADINNTPSNGLYYSSIADDSWKYEGYGSDVAGVGTHDKRFSLEQFTHWLDVTTLRRSQPLVFLWMLDIEVMPQSTVLNKYNAMIDQADEAAQQVGIESTHHVLITPYMMIVGNDGGDLAHTYLQEHQEVCATIAIQRDNVAAISIYDATDGSFFIGTSYVNQWLLDRGFNAMECGTQTINLCDSYYGNLLDGAGIHPANDDAGMFFAAIMGNEIRKGACPADLVPDGIIGVSDLLEMIDFWGDSDGGDIDGDGVTNVTDLLQLIDAWGDCWPVQAPFSTGQFE